MGFLSAVITSPPYAAQVLSGGDTAVSRGEGGPASRKNAGKCLTDNYGTHPGQLGALKAGEPPVTTTASGVPVQTWEKCYNQGWKGIIVPEAYRHPAKFAYGLVQRILAFGLEQGFWRPGDVLGDPFGGVALGGILAGYVGLHWRGVELEPAFVALGKKNLALHRPKWARLGLPVTATLTQGDSRHFAALVGQCGAVVTSPPYADTATIASGVQRNEAGWHAGKDLSAGKSKDYGQTAGNLGNLPAGTLDGAVTSPPYAESLDKRQDRECDRQHRARIGCDPDSPASVNCGRGYGTTPGQLGALPAGTLDGAVTSPPYAEGLGHGGTPTAAPKDTAGTLQAMESGYGTTNGQVGRESGDTYWQAVAQIYQQVRLALKPGGVFVCVVKSFVKDKAIVDLPGQTAQLLTRLGFTVFLEVHALLTHEETHPGLFGSVTKKREKKSFFRRLAEKKGSPPIDHETVLFCRSPP